MSDTIEENDEAVAQKPIPNFAVTPGTSTRNGITFNTLAITYGEPARNVTVRELDIGDQFDIAEIAGDGASQTWQAMALIAKSVMSVDGVTVPPSMTKQQIRTTLVRVGTEGLSAIARASSQPAVPAGTVESAAKN